MSSPLTPGLPTVDAPTPAPLVLPGTVCRAETDRLCADVRAQLLATGADVVVCDAAALATPGLAAVDLLARLELAARRAGGRIRIRNPTPRLRELLQLAGLRLEMERHPEQREPPRRVQEAVEPGDPPL
ncbi:STAS domain-containing protein [Streptomyces himalayensis]|uniref:STAS domain-containing protein n=2 Tax=Streptomyces himalayensis TaxID=2820085 RepID=A0A7W2HEX0_9ACTN|nr:STAS domain-containing protein [Streptomyces himalayensis]MBA2949005.1 STAS domain-containing protein [Streptomyces himalayensis subsp. himalayensis]MBA4861285.1 STAS domain-containing protein [Streptomyces himalayensis subsp. aureolus]